MTGANGVSIFMQEAKLAGTGAGPFIACPAGIAFISMSRGSILGDGVNAAIAQSAAGFPFVSALGDSSVTAGAVTGGGDVFWDLLPPGAQGVGVTVAQEIGAGSFTNPLSGALSVPLSLAQTAPISLAAGHVLTAAEYVLPSIICNGILGAGETLTFPDLPGTWDVDLSAVTLGVNTLTLQAGTGAGGTTSVTAAQLAATGAKGVRVQRTAANKLVRLS